MSENIPNPSESLASATDTNIALLQLIHKLAAAQIRMDDFFRETQPSYSESAFVQDQARAEYNPTPISSTEINRLFATLPAASPSSTIPESTLRSPPGLPAS